ncbi:DUF2309 domain-containing protein [Stappia sp.]|uniref:YbcC family protein n=1 Tax=Stappia sp. TaxID=1870903 RepID=UPI0032D8FC0D
MTAQQIADISAVQAAANAAAKRVAPLWPLKTFVAVNPYFGLADKTFASAATRLARVAGARTTQDRAVYRAALEAGEITPADLLAARQTVDHPDLPRDAEALARMAAAAPAAPPEMLPTIADLAGARAGKLWTELVTERISAHAAAFFDEGQAGWTSPVKGDGLYAGWRAEAAIDRTPDLAGLKGARAAIARLPETPEAVLAAAASTLGLEGAALELYFHRLLMSVGGWAAYARHKVWQSELAGESDPTLIELLAIRAGWDLAILEADARLGETWQSARAAYAAPDAPDADLALDCLLQAAFDRAAERRLAATFARTATASAPDADSDLDTGAGTRKAVQAVFCIDVRSEVYRRALESVAPRVETIGFAGFFGFAIEYVRFGETRGAAQCPVLLTPQKLVCEAVDGADEGAIARRLTERGLTARIGAAWSSFKLAAVSSFAFVETLGLAYLGKLVTDGLGLRASADGDPALKPQIAPGEIAGRASGFSLAERIDAAEGVLKAMSLTENFARLVLLAGHGSTTVNNPHASGLDCGACGGHTGEANARVGAAILNDPQVREGLAERGIAIPTDTVFLAGLHDTTTDRLTLFDRDSVPASHAGDVADLLRWAEDAGRLTRAERAGRLPLAPGADAQTGVLARAANWAETRPEWGLAGCSSFIAAPRGRTAALDLGGSAFLHSYDWRKDTGFGTLELILTAPVVVASWINLQYYASSVDNAVFGSGNKVLHNVVGGIGVLEGGGGDLRVGLPWQSVHDGERLMHAPKRLKVVVEAPQEAILDVIARHALLRDLFDNGWVTLFALGEDGRIAARYAGELTFETLPATEADPVAHAA